MRKYIRLNNSAKINVKSYSQNICEKVKFDKDFDWLRKAFNNINLKNSGAIVIVKNYYSKETVEQWVMYTLYKVTVKLMYTLYNDLTNFSKKIVKSA